MKLGIVGLPNVGKSTLFNAITKSAAPAENYPFCTIDPNIGLVEVPDDRLSTLTEMFHSKKTIPAAVEFVDIAGLVRGASKGEGLGNKFLENIRSTDAIVEVLRCFEDRMVGIITADDIFDVLSDEFFEDFTRVQGITDQEEEDYLDTPVFSFFKNRIIWLLVLMVSASITGMVISHFEEVLAANVLLTAFIPMLMDSSGNAGSQSSSTVIRALSLEEVDPSHTLGVLWKEFRIGIVCGLAFCVFNGIPNSFLII